MNEQTEHHASKTRIKANKTTKRRRRLAKLLASAAVAAAISFTSASSAFAQTDSTWTGGGDGTSWSDAANWSAGVPNGLFNAFIDGGNGGVNSSVLTGVSQSIALDSLTIDVGDTLTIQNNTDLRIVTDAGRPLSGSINNSGSMLINNSGSTTNLYISNSVLLNGGGFVTLAGTTENSAIRDNSGANGVFTNVNNTIQGRGQIGSNTLTFTNQAAGVVDANDNTGSLTIDPLVGAFATVNQGMFRASSGGNLRLAGGDINNSGGMIEALAGSKVSLIGSTNISGGTLRSVGDGMIEVEASQVATLSGLTVQGTVSQLNNSDAYLNGAIDNQSSWTIANTGSTTNIYVGTFATLSGGGSITLAGTSDNSAIRDSSGANGVFTNVNNTIQGRGQIGSNTLTFTNQMAGVVDANDAVGSLTIDPLTGVSATVNQGVFRASSGGNLRLAGGDINNSGGMIEALAGSKVSLFGSTNITGGTLRTVGDGLIEVEASQVVTLSDLTVQGIVSQLNNSDAYLDGAIDNQSSWTIANTGSTTNIYAGSSTTLSGGGSITLTGTSDNSAIRDNSGANGVFTNVNNTIQGRGQIGSNTLTFTNQAAGVVDANDNTGSLTIDPLVGASATVNQGVFRASSGGNLRLAGGDFNNSGGMIEALAGSKVSLFASANVTGGTLRSVDDGLIEVEASQVVTLSDLTVQGIVSQLNNSDAYLNGAIDNQSSWSVANTGSTTNIYVGTSTAFSGGGSVTLAGSTGVTAIRDNSGSNGVFTNVDNTIQGQGQIGVNTLEFINQAGGVVDANDLTGSGMLVIDASSAGLTNEGTLRSSNGAILAIVDGFTNNGTLDAVSGLIDINGSLDAASDSLLMGNGEIEATTINNAGTIAPGASVGSLTIDADLVMMDTSLLQIELDASGADLLAVDGNWTLDGILEAEFLGGFVPGAADSYVVGTTTGAFSGAFDNVADGGLLNVGGLGDFTVTYGGSDIVLSNFVASSVPEPGSAAVILGLFGVVALRRRR